ncbi:MAG: hypothetical protein H6687_02795 [Bacillales bacterium]|nr:hypothetical protein [Bacillales bacterium]
MVDIGELLSIYTESDIDDFLKKYTGITLNEKNLSYEKIKKNYRFIGNSESNGSNIGQLTSGEKGVVERITNAIDAVIENEKSKNNILVAKDSKTIIKKAFPNFYSNMHDVMSETTDKSLAKDAENLVILAVNDGSKSNKPTLDIVDSGTGLSSYEFETTILSINHGNKLPRDKSYLIGAFGQGGSTSLAFAYATIIVSKKDDKISFTIVKRVELIDYKNMVYVYLTIESHIPNADYSNFISENEYLNRFINETKSGTIVRMVESEISKRFRDNEVTKPGMLGDYLNTELFNVGLPVKIIENRSQYKDNVHVQNRSVYGSLSKLKTSKKYVKKDYCGIINFEHNNHSYSVDYYVLLPTDETKWGSESECKTVFEQFNVYYDPIIYTVNGQTITTERYTKLNNAGLNFLRYRLLVVINLDVLESEKYKFFTTDRSRIIDSDLTHGFLDKIIKALATTEKLLKINEIVGEKSISSSIDKELIDDVSRQIKNEYDKYLKTGILLSSKPGHHYNPDIEEIYENQITSLVITSAKREFYKDENIIFIVSTGAQKHVNSEAVIYMYIDERAFYDYNTAFMNGRIQYSINAGAIKTGSHSIQYSYFKDNISYLQSDKLLFEVLSDKAPERESKNSTKNLDINIKIINESGLICDIARDQVNKKIDVKLCFENEKLKAGVFGFSSSSDEILRVKNIIIKPTVLFCLFYGEKYDNISEDDEKNKIVISFIRAFISCSNNNIS